ncbi:MAG: nucleoside 2-deoxyribosyltransferase [Candidatus Thiosymbion ectosymbiont of Robbea hypermnestra]|nr:nucleoside 2-deoxyribosyltransferase [Candidatus Thiosymbion ectosymbiont of Robbea hypermnestra]
MNWINLFGNTTFDKGELTYHPTPTTKLEMSTPGFAYTKSDVYFENGEIEFSVKLEDASSSCQLVFNYGLQNQINVGLNYNNAPYGIGILKNNVFENLSVSGIGTQLLPQKTYSVKVTVKGSKIELFVDNVSVCTANATVEKAQLTFYFGGNSPLTVSGITISQDTPRVFVVMQFTEEFDELYDEVIKPVCEDFGFDATRADDIFTQNPIIQDIADSIQESAVVIADITPNNPNVYYEVGYSHGINKPTILLCDTSRERLPFDLSGIRTIFYKNKIAGKSKIEGSLRRHLESLGS